MSFKDFINTPLVKRTAIAISSLGGVVAMWDVFTRDNPKNTATPATAKIEAVSKAGPEIQYTTPYHGLKPVVKLNRIQTEAEKKETLQLLQSLAKAVNYEHLASTLIIAGVADVKSVIKEHHTFQPEEKNKLTQLGVENIAELVNFASRYVQTHKAAPVRAFAEAQFQQAEKFPEQSPYAPRSR